jgi:hypothetical protein
MDHGAGTRGAINGGGPDRAAGYLHFPKLSKKPKNAGYDLTHYGANSKIKLLIAAVK